jgi:hypothetical protein
VKVFGMLFWGLLASSGIEPLWNALGGHQPERVVGGLLAIAWCGGNAWLYATDKDEVRER